MSEIIPHWINGAAHVINNAPILRLTSPVDGSPNGQVQLADKAILDDAVCVAEVAFDTWRRIPIKDRVQPLYRFKQLCENRMPELAATITKENGKTLAEAEAGVRKGLEVVEFAAAIPNMLPGELLEVSSGVDCYTRRYPLGVVTGITPFNFPAMVPLWMFPIAISMGNTFILKPSEQVPHTAVLLAQLLEEAGLPKGVFQVVHGDRSTVENILDHPSIAAAAFVGSSPVAKAVYLRGVGNGKRVLALGGAKNHLVVLPDADVEITAKNVTSSVTGCAGQRCMAASVLIAVGDSENLVNAIEAEMRKIRPGKEMGAIISLKAKERIESYLTMAAKANALRVDGRSPKVDGLEGGNYVGPSIIDGVLPSHACACDEIFGPVLTILRVKTLDEALAIENASPFGNAAAIYTTNPAAALYFEDHAQAGMIGINIGVPVPREPFSFGGWNDSRFGQGDITGREGIHFWTKLKKVTEKWSARASKNWMS